MATTLPLVVSAGQSLSAPLSVAHGLRLVRIGTPAAWDAAPLTFQISVDEGTTWLDLQHAAEGSSGLYAPYETGLQSVVANSIVSLPAEAGLNIGWLKIRSGTRSKPVNQTADRTFMIMFG